MENRLETDILIIGSGIVGLSVARELSLRHHDLRITVLEKEAAVALHASGRNSGVIHAGFYYTPGSLKAKLTVNGNRLMTEYCLGNGLQLNRCGKVVVAADEKELDSLFELKRRGDANGVDVKIIDEKALGEIEPNAKTFGHALYSLSTSVVDPKEVVRHMVEGLKGKADILLGERFVKRERAFVVSTSRRKIGYRHLINTAGLYADTIAHQFGVGRKYTLVPFKGLYMEYKDSAFLGRHLYPVPDLNNPFLGVHFTKTANGSIKIGPTATPAFWRENYNGVSNFSLPELMETLSYTSRLFISNSFNFRRLAFDEFKKYFGQHLAGKAARLVRNMDNSKVGRFLAPGIRAQLLDTSRMELVMDFVIESEEDSTHILNAVSPAFTCSLSFARLVADKIENRCFT